MHAARRENDSLRAALLLFWDLFGVLLFPEYLKKTCIHAIMGNNRYHYIPAGGFDMAKQVHIRVDDAIYEELSEYSALSGQSMQDCLSVAIRQLLIKNKVETPCKEYSYTFIDLFAGIGGMRIAFERAGGHCVYSNEWNKHQFFTHEPENSDGPEKG